MRIVPPVLKGIRDNIHFKAIPVIILTTSENLIDIKNTYELGANAYVSKPFDMDGLHHLIKSIGDFWIDLAHRPHSSTRFI